MIFKGIQCQLVWKSCQGVKPPKGQEGRIQKAGGSVVISSSGDLRTDTSVSSVEKTWSNSARQGRLLSDTISLHSYSRKSEAGITAQWLKTFTKQA